MIVTCEHCGKQTNISLRKENKKGLGVELIINIVCDYFNVDILELKNKSRYRKYVYARQLIMYFLTREQITLKEIGKIFNRDHTTVVHANRTIRNLLYSDDNVQEDVAKIKILLYTQQTPNEITQSLNELKTIVYE
jgi:chromosomal replication initiation ATPase DnaA